MRTPRSLQGSTHSRGYLLHVDGPNAIQFITIRLADSLPDEVVRRIRALRSTRDRRRSIEASLDQSFGSCVLSDPRCASIVAEALRHRDGREFEVLAWVVMPNHVHLLVRLLGKGPLAGIMRRLKSWTARDVNRASGRSGALWQRDYFDRQATNEDEIESMSRYIELNPVNAGLCRKPHDWRSSSAWYRMRSGGAPL